MAEEINPELLHRPLGFPRPPINQAQQVRVNVRMENGTIRARNCLRSSMGEIYEIGARIQKTIFGMVVEACCLTFSEEQNTALQIYTRTEQRRAIKIYFRSEMNRLRGRVQENPETELSALTYIGDNHPNLLGNIECAADNENFYSVMRLIRGGELFARINDEGPMTENEARVMFRQVMNGLLRLQQMGIAHRDMSLENILYDGDDYFIIIDFGMCLRVNRDPITGAFLPIVRQTPCGKQVYMAPEVVNDQMPAIEGEPNLYHPMLSDMWSCGIILFIALTQTPPVGTATTADGRYNVIAAGGLQELVNKWQLELSGSVVDLIQRMLRPLATDRITVEQVLNHPWMQMDENQMETGMQG